jgi:putative Ca2+/H+ antiporter (TMEM165/GDT1 family)
MELARMSPSLTAAVASFAAVLPAEIPDKTILACLILSSRYRPTYVFIGAAAAFAVQVAIAVAVGGALSLLPHRWVYAATALAFLVGAVLLWRHKEESGSDDEAGRDGVRESFWPVVGTAFAVVFLAEFGDLTQLTTVGLAARFHDPIGVGIGATLGLWTATALAVVVGWRLLRLVKVSWLTKIASVIMLILAGTSVVAAVAA